MNFEKFVSESKSMVVAPAGYGKTHAIALCLRHAKGKQLILTHTNAGVASLKEKIMQQGIDNKHYRVETITGFAQKYVNAFYCGDDIPEQEDSRVYYPFIIEKAKNLLEITPIRDVVRSTYSGLFVDEYQDCIIGQHNFIKTLGEILPIHILGDPLQGIFDFHGESLVDFEKDLNDFKKYPNLTEPWRWKINNPGLGESLKKIRTLLEEKREIDLNLFNSYIEILLVTENDKYALEADYNIKIWSLLQDDNVLIIHPESSNKNARKKFVSLFKNKYFLLEAIDDIDFYKFSKEFDKMNSSIFCNILYKLFIKLFNGKTSIEKWFNESGVKRKRLEKDKNLVRPIAEDVKKIKQKFSLTLILEILKETKELPEIKCYREELFNCLCRALEKAEYKNISVYEAMKEIRNIKRRTGRKIEGKCIGTTLLTKGLEFDTVAVLDAHKFKCPKNFYVAVTRASKKLIIFTNNKILSPYKEEN
jgi:DNA helicase-2/ATP-dependent DNA helicase PcrA